MSIWSNNKRGEIASEISNLPSYYTEKLFNRKQFINDPRAASKAGQAAFAQTSVCQVGKPSISLAQAMLRYKELRLGTEEYKGGIGVTKGGNGSVCEWVIPDSKETIDIVYLAAVQKFMASVGNMPLDLHTTNAAPFIFCLIGYYYQSFDEFAEHLESFVAADTSTKDGATEELLALCRIAACLDENVPMDDIAADRVSLLTQSHKGSKRFESELFEGTLRNFLSQKKRTKASFDSTKEFCGAYSDGRELSELEKSLVPSLGKEYVVPAEVTTICSMIQSTKQTARPFNNVLLRGDPSVGKTAGARAIAAGLGLPYVSVTCNAGTELYNLIGEMMPVPGETVPLESMPSATEISMDPVTSYKAITGVDKPDATEEECMEELLKRKDEPKFVYIESPLVKAIRNGWVVEIQEPSLIQRPGVLPGLNGLMDEGRVISLPTGELLRRHPDCVIISTLNVDLNGCKPMNESFIDRHHIIMDMKLPNENVIIERIRAMTGCDASVNVVTMLQAVKKIAKIAEMRGVMDGNINSMRSLSNWVTAVMITGDYISSAEWTVISGATSDKEVQGEMKEAIQAFSFA